MSPRGLPQQVALHQTTVSADIPDLIQVLTAEEFLDKRWMVRQMQRTGQGHW